MALRLEILRYVIERARYPSMSAEAVTRGRSEGQSERLICRMRQLHRETDDAIFFAKKKEVLTAHTQCCLSPWMCDCRFGIRLTECQKFPGKFSKLLCRRF